MIAVDDLDLFGLQTADVDQMAARDLGHVPVGKGGDQRLLEDARLILRFENLQVSGVNLVDAMADVFARLGQQLPFVVLGWQGANQAQNAVPNRDFQIVAVNRMRLVDPGRHDDLPPGVDGGGERRLVAFHVCFRSSGALRLQAGKVVERPALAGQAPQLNNAIRLLATRAS